MPPGGVKPPLPDAATRSSPSASGGRRCARRRPCAGRGVPPCSLKDRQEIAAAEAALRGVEPSAWVFPAPTDPGKPVNPAFTRFKLWYKVLTLAGLRSVPLHALRDTYASLLLQAGEAIAYVQLQLGHSSIQLTVDRYGHFIPGANRQAVERLAAMTATLAEPAELSRN
jgi:hypothetical protein